MAGAGAIQCAQGPNFNPSFQKAAAAVAAAAN